jgi:hypothetical protein
VRRCIATTNDQGFASFHVEKHRQMLHHTLSFLHPGPVTTVALFPVLSKRD